MARDLCNASMTSKELYAASMPAFWRLSNFCSKIDMEHTWIRLLSNPKSLSDQEILDLTEHCKLRPFGSRAVKLIGLLKVLGVSKPTRLPARLLMTVHVEKFKVSEPFRHLAGIQAFSTCQQSDFHYRKALIAEGLPTVEALDVVQSLAHKLKSSKLKAGHADSLLRRAEAAASRAYEDLQFAKENLEEAKEQARLAQINGSILLWHCEAV